MGAQWELLGSGRRRGRVPLLPRRLDQGWEPYTVPTPNQTLPTAPSRAAPPAAGMTPTASVSCRLSRYRPDSSTPLTELMSEPATEGLSEAVGPLSVVAPELLLLLFIRLREDTPQSVEILGVGTGHALDRHVGAEHDAVPPQDVDGVLEPRLQRLVRQVDGGHAQTGDLARTGGLRGECLQGGSPLRMGSVVGPRGPSGVL